MSEAFVPKPQALVCPVCGESYEFTWDGESWTVDTEQWSTDGYPFLDSRHCWLKARGFTYDQKSGMWAKFVPEEQEPR